MTSNQPFGAFLRSRRERMHPDGRHEADRPRRRTPGLKREEVAFRAGISTEWYVKLEQGRVVAPSPDTLEALGQALQLDAVDKAHLRTLAAGGRRQAFQRESVPEALRRLVTRLPDPAYITGQRWDMLAWNHAATALFGDFGRLAPEDRNILHWMLTDAAARTLFGESWHDEARRMVALFRVAHDLWSGDAAFTALVARLCQGCPEFGGWWATHNIGLPVHGTKHLLHPMRGSLRFDYATFQANDDPSLKLALYTER